MITQENKDIENKLNSFLKTKKIPNIIFHGKSGSGKREIVHKFILDIFENNLEIMEKNILYTNCAHSKGIKFIRNDMKFFAKTHINDKKYSSPCKLIIMSNAEYLTTDAQSALRRCIEVFSNTTRFILITENKSLLMAPILSRFCDIYIPEPILPKYDNNYHKMNTMSSPCYTNFTAEIKKRKLWLKTLLNKQTDWNQENILELSTTLYENSYSGLDVIDYIKYSKIEDEEKYKFLIMYDVIKANIRSEQLLIFIILIFRFLRSNVDLENILFM